MSVNNNDEFLWCRGDFFSLSWEEDLGLKLSVSHCGQSRTSIYITPKEAREFLDGIKALVTATEGRMGLHDSLAEEFTRREAEMKFHDLSD
jgi:hypothetical protein